jgi:hypothetical protein
VWRQGCRCLDCRAAVRKASKAAWAAARLRRGADPQSWTPARPVRARIVALEAARWTRARIAEAAGVAPATVTRIGSGHVAHVRRRVARALLAVEP